jgi:hypothetical protein
LALLLAACASNQAGEYRYRRAVGLGNESAQKSPMLVDPAGGGLRSDTLTPELKSQCKDGLQSPPQAINGDEGTRSYFVRAITEEKYFEGKSGGVDGNIVITKTIRTDGMAIALGRGEGGCYWLTANHVVSGAKSILLSRWSAVQSDPPEERSVAMVWSDPATDSALLYFATKGSCEATVSVSSDVGIKDDVYLYGQPALFQGAVSRGIVSAYWTLPERGLVIVSDAIASTGFSGGGAYGSNGRLLGMTDERTGNGHAGLTYIVPICRIVERMPDRKIGVLPAPEPVSQFIGTSGTSTGSALRHDQQLDMRE